MSAGERINNQHCFETIKSVSILFVCFFSQNKNNIKTKFKGKARSKLVRYQRNCILLKQNEYNNKAKLVLY